MNCEPVKLLVDAGIGISAIAGILWAVVKIAGQRTTMLLKILDDHAKERESWKNVK
jgi:hypothetical protein